VSVSSVEVFNLLGVIPPADLRELRAGRELAGKTHLSTISRKDKLAKRVTNAASSGLVRITPTRKRRYSSRDISLLAFWSARSFAMRSLTPACFIQSLAHTSAFLLSLPATRRYASAPVNPLATPRTSRAGCLQVQAWESLRSWPTRLIPEVSALFKTLLSGEVACVKFCKSEETQPLGLSFMNTEFVTVGIQDNGCPAARHVERLKGELNIVTSEMIYRLVEIVRFQHKLGTFARRHQEWFISDGERVSTDLIFGPELCPQSLR
jgi:hypothetical protein